MFCFVCISSTYVFGTLLTANGDLRLLNLLAGSAVVVNIGLNFLFIVKWQALGSAVASLITQLMVSIVQIIVSKNKFHIRVTFSGFTQFLFFVFGVLSISYVSYSYFSNWVVAIVVFVFCSFVFSSFIRMIPIKRLIHILRDD